MKKKIIGIFLCIILIVASLSATGSTNVQTTRYTKENNNLETYPSTPTDSLSIITIKIVAKVIDVADPYNLLDSKIKVNDSMTGKYIYDSEIADPIPDPHMGLYMYNSSSFGIEINAGRFAFKTNSSAVNFGIIIRNDYFLIHDYIDQYIVYSINNLPLSNGMEIQEIVWQLEDPTCTALSSDALPTTVPVLLNWEQSDFGLMISGYNPSDQNKTFLIQANVTKVTKSRTRNVYSNSQTILNWLLEHFANLFPILRHLMKL